MSTSLTPERRSGTDELLECVSKLYEAMANVELNTRREEAFDEDDSGGPVVDGGAIDT